MTVFFHMFIFLHCKKTWLSAVHNVHEILPTHHFLRQDRTNQYRHDVNLSSYITSKAHGGVGMLIKKDIPFIVRDVSNIALECICIQLTHPDVIVCNIYRPPWLPCKYLCRELQKLFQMFPYGKIVVTGDFNINLMCKDSTHCSNMLPSFEQVINCPTTEDGTLIDHIYVRNIEPKMHGVVPIYYNHHDITYLTI